MSTIGPVSIRSTSCDISLAGTRKPMVPFGVTIWRTSRGNCCVKPSLCSLSTTSVTGPGQQRRASRRASGDISGTKSGASSALLMASVNGWLAGSAFDLQQSLDGIGPAGAGGQAVNRFGRQRDQAAPRPTLERHGERRRGRPRRYEYR